MIDQFSLQPDLETTRVIELDNNKMYIKRSGEHGFWRVNLDKGQLPESLQGEYTSAALAETSARAWAASKKRTIVAAAV